MVIGNDFRLRVFVCLVMGIMFFGLIGFVEMVEGLGASSYHWSGNPVNISQGEEKIISINLQTRLEEGDMNIKGEVVSGGEIVSLVEDKYFLEAGVQGVQVNLSIDVPSDFESGKYEMIVKFVPVDVAGEGMVSLSVGTSKRIPIIIGGSLVEKSFVDDTLPPAQEEGEIVDGGDNDEGADEGSDEGGSLVGIVIFFVIILVLIVGIIIIVFYLLNRKKESESVMGYY
ncbi:hypothetical protein HOD75_02265 [archaeon]|jgi:hypothetical protein|nr:hypothetical protein [archaeon]MBT4241702.1 hypothetical protein [archaeon]MBT4418250.1 hypothetical protein [archaeon]